jgi:hypothetical protein
MTLCYMPIRYEDIVADLDGSASDPTLHRGGIRPGLRELHGKSPLRPHTPQPPD